MATIIPKSPLRPDPKVTMKLTEPDTKALNRVAESKDTPLSHQNDWPDVWSPVATVGVIVDR
jgi:hypothetical protein